MHEETFLIVNFNNVSKFISMIHSEELIVLSCTKVGDKSLVIHSLSETWGRRSFIVNASRDHLALLMPLSIVEAEICENRSSSLWRARKLSSNYPLNGIRGQLQRNTITLFMSEVLFRIIKDGVKEPGFYQWCKSSILTLNDLDTSYPNFHIRWLLDLAVAMGFMPDTHSLSPFAGEYMSVLDRFLRCNWAESMLIPLNGEMRSEIAKCIINYLGFHCESHIQIRSLEVLRELYR